MEKAAVAALPFPGVEQHAKVGTLLCSSII